MNKLTERIKQPLLKKDVGEKKIREDYWMIFNEFTIAEFMMSDCIRLGKERVQDEIIKIIEENKFDKDNIAIREFKEIIIKKIKGGI